MTVKKPKHVCIQSARSFVGKQASLHFVDGTVLVNVFLEAIEESSVHGKKAVNRWVLKVRPAGGRLRGIPLRYVVLIEVVSPLVQLLLEVSC